jgi:hypothetical protein
MANLELEDVEGEYCGLVDVTFREFIWREELRNNMTNLTQKTGHQFYIWDRVLLNTNNELQPVAHEVGN